MQEKGKGNRERERNPIALLVGMQTGAATVESSMETSQAVKNGSAFWPSDPTSGTIYEETQNTNSREYKHPYIYCSVIYNNQYLEAAQVSINRWVDKTTMGHLHNGILLCHKKKKILPFVTAWMDLENIMLLKEANQRKTNTIWFHSYVESNEQTELISRIETDS